MILFTTGTNEQPFDRLVSAATELDGDEALFVQRGSSQVEPGRGTWVDFLPFEELAEHMREARVVVCHAGVGSIILARRCGHRPVVLPRRVHLGEAVDDHQLELARRLHEAGIVTLAEHAEDLAAAIAGTELGLDSEPERPGIAGAVDLTTDLRLRLEHLRIRPQNLDDPVGSIRVRGAMVDAR